MRAEQKEKAAESWENASVEWEKVSKEDVVEKQEKGESALERLLAITQAMRAAEGETR